MFRHRELEEFNVYDEEKMNKKRIGKIVNTHGIKGEVKCKPVDLEMEQFHHLERVYLETSGKGLTISNIRMVRDFVYLTFQNHHHIDQVLPYKNDYLIIYSDITHSLPKDHYYVSDLIGVKVYNETDQYLGSITNVHQTGANDVYELDHNSHRLIPAIKQVIIDINMAEKTMKVKLLEGLWDED